MPAQIAGKVRMDLKHLRWFLDQVKDSPEDLQIHLRLMVREDGQPFFDWVTREPKATAGGPRWSLCYEVLRAHSLLGSPPTPEETENQITEQGGTNA